MGIEANSLFDSMQMIAKKVLESSKFDRTVQAIISSCVDSAKGKYVIKYQGEYFYAYAAEGTKTYTAGTSVYVHIPGGDSGKQKTILNSVKNTDKDYIDVIDDSERFNKLSPNLIIPLKGTEQLGLSSYDDNATLLLYTSEESEKPTVTSFIDIDVDDINRYIKLGDSIEISADFQTALPVEQQGSGNYGLSFELEFFTDDKKEQTESLIFELDVDNMVGNPYKFTIPTNQFRNIEIQSERFSKIKRIFFFAQGFPQTSEEKIEDIFVNNIQLFVTDALSDVDLKGYYLKVEAPKGSYFTADMSSTATLELKSTILLDGKESPTMSSARNFYWFKSNPKIENSSLEYCSYGGRGWECLNEYEVVGGIAGTSTEVREYLKAGNTLKVKKTDIVTSALQYKCVAVFDTTTIANTYFLFNEDSDYKINITPEPISHLQDGLVMFENGTGSVNLICTVEGPQKDKAIYYWGYTEANGSFYNLPESIDIIEKIKELEIQLESLINAGASEAEIKIVEKELATEKLKTRVEGNTIYNINGSSISSFRTYSCGISIEDNQIGSALIRVINKETTPDYTLTMINGTQAFQYLSNGISPASSSAPNPIKLKPIGFNLFDSKGNPLTDDDKRGATIRWTISKTNTLLKPNKSMAESLIEETDDYAIYGDTLEFVYDLAQLYKAETTNNTITLEVTYQGITLVQQSNFIFFKNGDDGTNATDYVAKIVKNTDNVQLRDDYILMTRKKLSDGTFVYSLDPGIWMSAQLWHDGEIIFNGTSTGNSTEGKQVKVQWELHQNKYKNIKDDSLFIIDKDTGYISFDTENEHPILNNKDGASSLANIVKVSLTYMNGNSLTTVIATMPIIFVDIVSMEEDYDIELIDGGFLKAKYNSEGRKPAYKNDTPLSLRAVYKVTDAEGQESWKNIYEDENFGADWDILGTIANATGNFVNSINILENMSKVPSEEFDTFPNTSHWFKPIDIYDGYCATNMVRCKIYKQTKNIIANGTNDTETIETVTKTNQVIVYIPIYLFLNLYFNDSVNGWDGNKVVANEDGDVILAPQVGAGVKNLDNTFSGVFMGQVIESSNKKIGLIGYSKGKRSIFLDAETGKSEFGTAGTGQVIIDPTDRRARIYGGNYDIKRIEQWEKKYADVEGKGMLIDLTTPYIDFGSGTFHVSPLGELFSTSGSIGGWTIKEKELISGDGMAGIRTYDSTAEHPDEGYAFWAGDPDPTKAEFSVKYSGQVKATNMDWGTTDPSTHDMIIISNGKIYSAIQGKEHSSLDSAEDGFYLGVDGLSVGGSASNEENFQVDKKGYAIIKKGIVSVWNIRENGLTSGKNELTDINKDGLFLGSNGFFAGAALEENKNGSTYISESGLLYSVKGKLSQWDLDTVDIHGETIHLKTIDNGLYCEINGIEKWGLHADGTVNLPIDPLSLKVENHSLDKVLVTTPEGGLFYCLGYEADDVEDPTGELNGFVTNCLAIYTE